MGELRRNGGDDSGDDGADAGGGLTLAAKVQKLGCSSSELELERPSPFRDHSTSQPIALFYLTRG